MAVRGVILHRQVLDSVLSYSSMFHPREGILLLRGRTKKGIVEVESVVIPPAAVHGQGFSSFGWHMLPIDLSFVGVAHSHPSGYAVPSHEDLLHVAGRIMVIVGFPYRDQDCVGVFNRDGEPLPFEVR